MPTLSLTDLVDIVSKAGKPKATKVRQVMERPDYEPAFDFYKALREHIVRTHKNRRDKSTLPDVLGKLTDEKKTSAYKDLITGYKTWWGRKALNWFEPVRGSFSHADIDVIVNPELGLEINGQRHLIKLYMKDERLSKLKIELIVDLMEYVLRPRCQAADCFAVLDVRASKLHALGPHTPDALPIVKAELAYVAAIWKS